MAQRGRGYTATLIDTEAAAIVTARGAVKPTARALGIAPQVVMKIRRGQPLRPSTWKRIRQRLGLPRLAGHDDAVQVVRLACALCGQRYGNALDRAACCLIAARPNSWCGWCGEPVGKGRAFCGRACSIEYAQDYRDEVVREDCARVGRA